MPHKHNAGRRHHIPKMSFKVRNLPTYEVGLRRRGSLSLWIEDAALECWQTMGPSGQARYTNAAIQTSLMLRAVSRRAVTLPVISAPSVPRLVMVDGRQPKRQWVATKP